jgi:hypothetical protein
MRTVLSKLLEKPPGGGRNGISTLNYLDWQEDNTVFEYLAARTGGSVTLTGLNEPLQLQGSRVSAHYFDIFRVRVAAGRAFMDGEDEPGKDHVAILSHALWQSQFGSDPSAIGRSIVLDGTPHTVIWHLARRWSSYRTRLPRLEQGMGRRCGSILGTPGRPATTDVLVRAAGGSRHGVIGRLRESGKPHAGSRDCAGARDRHPLFPWRRTMEISAPVAYKERIVVDLRRLVWSGAGVRDNGRATRKYFATEEPLGQRILVQEIVPGKAQLGPEIPWEVIGVVADEKVNNLDDTRDNPGMYVSNEQSPVFSQAVVVRTLMDTSRLEQAIRRAVC